MDAQLRSPATPDLPRPRATPVLAKVKPRTVTMCPSASCRSLTGIPMPLPGPVDILCGHGESVPMPFRREKGARYELREAPVQHARRNESAANKRARLTPNADVCGCVVHEVTVTLSGARGVVPYLWIAGHFPIRVAFFFLPPSTEMQILNLSVASSLLGGSAPFGVTLVAMGKKSASKDRGYITATEWKVDGGGYKDHSEGLPFRRLPFNCCAVSFLPFEDPVCAPDGTVMDIMHAVPYVRTHGRHPVSGEPLGLKDLTTLTFHKNGEGRYECPVLNKEFTNSTHIVAVKTTGNVYCFEAIDELCVKPKNWRDLLTDEKFTRKDLVTIQDPQNLAGRAVDAFAHVKKGHAVPAAKSDVRNASNVNQTAVSADVRRVLDKLGTSDASTALAVGGGGRKAQAERELAAAKQAAGGGGGDDAHKDKTHLLKGPSPASHPLDNVRFRPGSHTWNTDGETAHDAVSDAEKRRKAGEEKVRPGARFPNPPRAVCRLPRLITVYCFTSRLFAHTFYLYTQD